MKALTTHLRTAACLVVVLTTFGPMSAPKLMAAIKAAPVLNVDEKGRVPYQKVLSFDCVLASICDAYGLPMPTGKRLVVTHISGYAQTSAPGAATNPVIYYDDGRNPFIELNFHRPTSYLSRLVLSGYLMDCTNSTCDPIAQ